MGLSDIQEKIDSVINPKICRLLLVIIEIVLVFLAFLFSCIGLGLIVPVTFWQYGFPEWFDFYVTEIVFLAILLIGLPIVIVFTFVLRSIGHWIAFGCNIFGILVFFVLAITGASLYDQGDRNNSMQYLGRPAYYEDIREMEIEMEKDENFDRNKYYEKYLKYQEDVEKALKDLDDLYDTFGCYDDLKKNVKTSSHKMVKNVIQMPKLPKENFEEGLKEYVKEVEAFETMKKEGRMLKQQRDSYDIECFNRFEMTHSAFIVLADLFNWILLIIAIVGTLEAAMRAFGGSDGSGDVEMAAE